MNYTPWGTRTSPALVELTKVTPPKLLDWGLHISPEHRFVYVDNPKVGSGTIKARLVRGLSPETSQETLSAHNRSASPLQSPAHLTDEELEEALFSDAYNRFCFVRNPYTRVLSAYLDKMSLSKLVEWIGCWPNLGKGQAKSVNRRIRKRINYRRSCLSTLKKNPEFWWNDISFAEFLTWIEETEWYNCDFHWRRQGDNLLYNQINYTYIGYFESFEKDINEILSRIFMNVDGHYNTSYKSGYATQADDKIKDYYTDELCARVKNLYEDDFRNFEYDFSPPFAFVS